MSEFYYSANPTSPHDERLHDVEARGIKISAYTDSGVFSKEGLDEGSKLLIESLPPIVGRFLDFGCGWGVIGIIMAKAYPKAEVLMSDVNGRAAELAKKNIQLNGAANARALVSDGMTDVDGTFDVIALNPPIRTGKQNVYSMFAQCLDKLNAGGRLYVVIRKQQGAQTALEYLKSLFASAKRVCRDKGYWIIECEKGGTNEA